MDSIINLLSAWWFWACAGALVWIVGIRPIGVPLACFLVCNTPEWADSDPILNPEAERA